MVICRNLREIKSVDVVTNLKMISRAIQQLKNIVEISKNFFNVLGEVRINIQIVS